MIARGYTYLFGRKRYECPFFLIPFSCREIPALPWAGFEGQPCQYPPGVDSRLGEGEN